MNIFIFIHSYYNIMKSKPQYKVNKLTRGIKSIKDVLCTYIQTDLEIQCLKLISLLVLSEPNSATQVMLISNVNVPYAISVNLIILVFLTKTSI